MMEKIEGFKVWVVNGQEKQKTMYNGYLGSFVIGSTLKMYISVEAGHDIHIYVVDGKLNVVSKRNLADPSVGGGFYRLDVKISAGEDRMPRTIYPHNYLCLVEQNQDGTFQLWKIALISQAGQFFLITQKTCTGRLYRRKEKEREEQVICPIFDQFWGGKWPQMAMILSDLFQDRVGQLLPVSDYKPEPESSIESYGENKGHVRWFDLARGWGVIDTDKGLAYVFWREIKRTGRLQYLCQGELVSIESLTPGGEDASFPWVAHGVKSIPKRR